MKKYYYDLHIHTCLSPCGEEEMTPCNIAAMAKLIGLDVIAVTDHNSCGNAEAVMKASESIGGALVIPGLELETAESIHVLVLFDSLNGAKKCEEIVRNNSVKIKNKVEIYGRQIYMDYEDKPLGEEENLLVISTDISIENTLKIAAELGGVAIPAHIDKPSNAIIAILGLISPDMGFSTVELTPRASEGLREQLSQENYIVLHDSDAHLLENINEKNDNFLQIEELNIKSVIAALKNDRTTFK